MPRTYLTPDQAAELLGWEGKERAKRMLRVMLAKERALGRQIMHRQGGSGRGARYGLTEAMLHRHCQELFLATHDELLGEVRHQLGSIKATVVDKILELVAPELKQLRKRVTELEKVRR